MDWAQWLTFGWLFVVFFASCFPRQSTYCQASGHSGHKPTMEKTSIKTPGIRVVSSSRNNCMLSAILNNTGKPDTMTSGKFMTIYQFRSSVARYILGMHLITCQILNLHLNWKKWLMELRSGFQHCCHCLQNTLSLKETLPKITLLCFHANWEIPNLFVQWQCFVRPHLS